MSTLVEAIVGKEAAQGVRTSDGNVIEGDLVVVGVGAAHVQRFRRADAIPAGRYAVAGVVDDAGNRCMHRPLGKRSDAEAGEQRDHNATGVHRSTSPAR